MYSWNAVPVNWEHLSHRPSNTTVDLSVVLKPHSGSALIDALHEVNDLEKNQSSIYIPSHGLRVTVPWTGVHHIGYDTRLSKEHAAGPIAPHQALSSSSIPDSSTTTNTLMLTGVSVSRANDLLDALYQLHRHAKTNEIVVRTVGYALPAVLRGHVRTVARATPRLQQTPRKRAGRATAEPAKVAPGKPVTVPSRRGDDDACGISRRLPEPAPRIRYYMYHCMIILKRQSLKGPGVDDGRDSKPRLAVAWLWELSDGLNQRWCHCETSLQKRKQEP
ncbi:hypothetical protein EDB86DRAFT_2837345 [Lactarius hatsudake]|nr:hypothetical protein EDB86DRAFT_2837345 [Lactarius hatsudake]